MATTTATSGISQVHPFAFATNQFVDFVSTTSGLLDCLKVIDYSMQWFGKLPFLCTKTRGVLGYSRMLVGRVGIPLYIPDLISGVVKSVASFKELKQSIEDRSALTQSALRDAAVSATHSGASLVSTVADLTTVLHDTKLVDLGKAYPVVSGVFNAACLITDSIDISKEFHALQECNHEIAATMDEPKATDFKNKKFLSMLKIAKSVASIACAVLGIAALVFVSAFTSWTVLPIAALALTSIWLTAKIGCHFYEKCVIEKPAPPKV